MPYAPEFFRAEFASVVADFKNSVANRSNAQVSCAGQFIGTPQRALPFVCELTCGWIHRQPYRPGLVGFACVGTCCVERVATRLLPMPLSHAFGTTAPRGYGGTSAQQGARYGLRGRYGGAAVGAAGQLAVQAHPLGGRMWVVCTHTVLVVHATTVQAVPCMLFVDVVNKHVPNCDHSSFGFAPSTLVPT